MSDPIKTIKLNYPSEDRFLRDYRLLREGRLGIPTPAPFPAGIKVCLALNIPGLSGPVTLYGFVEQCIDKETAAAQNLKPGMMISLNEDYAKSWTDLEKELYAHEVYRTALNLSEPAASPSEPGPETASPEPADQKAQPPPPPPPDPDADREPVKVVWEAEEKDEKAETEPPPPAPQTPAKPSSSLDFDWLREVITQAEVAFEEEEEPEAPPPPPAEKKELTPEERERLKPSGDFLMNLTKAMLRSGYYSPDHPESKTVKTGLYEELLKALGDAPEIMLTNQETRERTDVLITGVLEEPVSVRTVVGAGMAELFVPRLRDYYNRKGLVSFAIKREISPEHFYDFVDVMSDPKVDRGDNARVGELLTNSLVEHGITEISTVFMDDIIVLEHKLPWRVEMAIQRLAKDLKVLPMFKDKTPEQVRSMKTQIIQDIIRPLRHPNFLKDIVINCYIIAKHVKGLEIGDLEQIVINTFPMDMLMPTSRFIFAEMKHLKQKFQETPESQPLQNRLENVKNILKVVSKRVVTENAPGARNFLEEMYFNQILALDELPPVVQYRINSLLLADSVKEDPDSYVQGLLDSDTEESAMVLLKCFKRVAPILIEQGSWKELLEISRGADQAARSSRLFQGGANLPMRPLLYIFEELAKELGQAYIKVDKDSRDLLDELFSLIGPPAVGILGRVLSEAEDRGVRKSAVEGLVRMKGLALRWVRQTLDDASQQWFLHRNALLVMSRIGKGEEDAARIKKFLTHPRPRLREEALSTLLRLEGKAAEPSVLAALEDKDSKVQHRAASLLAMIQPLSEAGMNSILEKIAAETPKEKEAAEAHAKKLTTLVTALANLTEISNPVELEGALIGMAQKPAGGKKKGLLKRLKNIFEEEMDPALLAAVINCLGKLGGEKSLEFLKELSEQESEIGNKAQAALDRIKLRSDG